MIKIKKGLILSFKGFTAILAVQLFILIVAVTVQSCRKSHITGDRNMQKEEVATRSLGWVGAAWAVADFIDCYY